MRVKRYYSADDEMAIKVGDDTFAAGIYGLGSPNNSWHVMACQVTNELAKGGKVLFNCYNARLAFIHKLATADKVFDDELVRCNKCDVIVLAHDTKQGRCETCRVGDSTSFTHTEVTDMMIEMIKDTECPDMVCDLFHHMFEEEVKHITYNLGNDSYHVTFNEGEKLP